MDKDLQIPTLLLQLTPTFIVTVIIYMVFALLGNDFGIDGFLGLFLFQPIFAIVFSVFTIFICLIAGLPIRLNKTIKHWWITHFYVSLMGIFIGLSFLVLSILPQLSQEILTQIDGEETLINIPNPLLVYFGWFLTAFSILHVYPPFFLQNKFKSLFSKREL